MEKYYKVQISYPNGVVEVIEDDFQKGAEALDYGNGLLAQIEQNKGFHDSAEDEFGDKILKDAYFFIIEIDGENQKVVYDSRRP